MYAKEYLMTHTTVTESICTWADLEVDSRTGYFCRWGRGGKAQSCLHLRGKYIGAGRHLEIRIPSRDHQETCLVGTLKEMQDYKKTDR